jgi:multidrug efflux system membrane fusion protein
VRVALLLVAVALAGLGVAGLGGCGVGGSKPAATPSRGPRIPKVTTAPVESRVLTYVVRAIGSLDAYQWVAVPARVEGTIEQLILEQGDAVTPQKVLAVIDGQRFALEASLASATAVKAEASVDRAKAEVAEAEAALAEARGNLERREPLRARKLVTEEEYASAVAQVARLEASLEAARAGVAEAGAARLEAMARLALAKKNQADSEVRSPIAGRVEKKGVAVGQYVKVGDEIATLADLSALRLRFRVREAESARVARGLVVTFRVGALPEKDLHAEIFHVSAAADLGTRMVECLATVTDGDPALKPGFFADVTLETKAAAASIVVPEEAVLPTEQGTIAFVVEDGKAARRRLVVGMRTREGEVEVLSGLRPGESVVVKGAVVLFDGQTVEVVPRETAAPADAPK